MNPSALCDKLFPGAFRQISIEQEKLLHPSLENSLLLEEHCTSLFRSCLTAARQSPDDAILEVGQLPSNLRDEFSALFGFNFLSRDALMTGLKNMTEAFMGGEHRCARINELRNAYFRQSLNKSDSEQQRRDQALLEHSLEYELEPLGPSPRPALLRTDTTGPAEIKGCGQAAFEALLDSTSLKVFGQVPNAEKNYLLAQLAHTVNDQLRHNPTVQDLAFSYLVRKLKAFHGSIRSQDIDAFQRFKVGDRVVYTDGCMGHYRGSVCKVTSSTAPMGRYDVILSHSDKVVKNVRYEDLALDEHHGGGGGPFSGSTSSASFPPPSGSVQGSGSSPREAKTIFSPGDHVFFRSRSGTVVRQLSNGHHYVIQISGSQRHEIVESVLLETASALCDVCGSRFPSYEALIAHAESSHQPSAPDSSLSSGSSPPAPPAPASAAPAAPLDAWGKSCVAAAAEISPHLSLLLESHQVPPLRDPLPRNYHLFFSEKVRGREERKRFWFDEKDIGMKFRPLLTQCNVPPQVLKEHAAAADEINRCLFLHLGLATDLNPFMLQACFRREARRQLSEGQEGIAAALLAAEQAPSRTDAERKEMQRLADIASALMIETADYLLEPVLERGEMVEVDILTRIFPRELRDVRICLVPLYWAHGSDEERLDNIVVYTPANSPHNTAHGWTGRDIIIKRLGLHFTWLAPNAQDMENHGSEKLIDRFMRNMRSSGLRVDESPLLVNMDLSISDLEEMPPAVEAAAAAAGGGGGGAAANKRFKH